MAYILGFILGFQYIKYLNSKHKINLNNNLINDFFFFSIIGVIIGGRIGYILFSYSIWVVTLKHGGMNKYYM